MVGGENQSWAIFSLPCDCNLGGSKGTAGAGEEAAKTWRGCKMKLGVQEEGEEMGVARNPGVGKGDVNGDPRE